MRYPQLTGSAYFHPNGIRGAGAANANWLWGLTSDEYELHADLWPLNPHGDLLAIIMIESVEALQNIDAIVSTPGVGAIFVGNANDLRRSMGVPAGAPEIEMALQKILTACKAQNVDCGISASTASIIIKSVREGWTLIRSTTPAIQEAQSLFSSDHPKR
jgi:4-hydroxy-2-oxoheptanedioate aldolase